MVTAGAIATPAGLLSLSGTGYLTVIFATATGVPALLSARLVQGLFANAVAPGIGTASGAILSALAVRFLPDPTHLIYPALIAAVFFAGSAIAGAGFGSGFQGGIRMAPCWPDSAWCTAEV